VRHLLPLLCLACCLTRAGRADPPPRSEGSGLRLRTVLAGRRVRARLVNVGKTDLFIFVGMSCGGPSPPFFLIVNGLERPFRYGQSACVSTVAKIEKLAPGRSYQLLSDPVDDWTRYRVSYRSRHYCARGAEECWRGALATAEVRRAADEITLSLRLVQASRGALTLEISHRNAGREPLEVGIGPPDRLPGDALWEAGRQLTLEPLTPRDRGVAAVVRPKERLAARYRVKLGPGGHHLRAAYTSLPFMSTMLDDAVLEARRARRPSRGTPRSWAGRVWSSPLAVQVPGAD